jgi:MFS family permease
VWSNEVRCSVSVTRRATRTELRQLIAILHHCSFANKLFGHDAYVFFAERVYVPHTMIRTSALTSKLDAMAGGLPRAFWLIWSGTLVNRCGNFVLPFLAIYLTEARGLSPAQAGLIVALYGAGATIASPVGGYLSDHIGRRATLVLALGLGGAGMIAMGFAQRLEVIAPGIFAVALVTEMYRTATQAAVADIVPPHDRVRAYSLLYWVINLGFAVGLALGGALANASFLWLFVGDGITSIAFAVLIWFGVPETHPAHAAGRTAPARPPGGFFAPYRDRPFLVFVALGFLFGLIFMQAGTAMPLDMASHGLPKSVYGLILGLNGALIVVIQPWLGPLLARFDRSHTIAVGAVVVGIGFGINAIGGAASIYVLGVVLWTIGEIAVLPVSNTVVADLALPELRGRYQGAYGLSFGLAFCLAPIIGTFVLQHFGARALWLGCLGLGIAIAAGQLTIAPAIERLRAERMALAPVPVPGEAG